MKIHIALLTLPLASLLEASHHVGSYDENMRRKQNLWLKPCLHGSRQILASTTLFLDFQFTLIGENSVTECSGVCTDLCKFRPVTALEWLFYISVVIGYR